MSGIVTPRACNRQGEGGAFYFYFSKILVNRALERKHNFVCFCQKESGFCMFLSKRERPTGGKKWTWTRQFARPRPSSTSDEGGSVVPMIRRLIWGLLQKTQIRKMPSFPVVARTPFWSFCAGQRRIGPVQITDGT